MESKLVKHSLIYSAASILAQAVVLLMVPVFTRNMSQEQFGQYNLLISIQSLLGIIITLGIDSGMTRFINEFADKNRTKNIVLTFSLAWGLGMYLISFLYGDLFYHVVFPKENDGGYYVSYLVASSVLLCLISVYNSYYTMLFRPKIVSISNLSRVLAMLFFSVFFIIIRKEGVVGALKAQLTAFAAVSAGLLFFDRKQLKLAVAWPELKLMLKYSLGLLPGLASAWVYSLLDRYFIGVMIGLEQVAIYSLGYKIGMIMDPVFIRPFKAVFTSFKYKAYKEVNAPEKFRKIYVYYNFIGWLCILGFSVFAKPAIALLSTAEYGQAFLIVPLIAFSYFLYGLGEFYSLGIHIQNKSLLDSLILGIGAGANILLNIGLIPRLGTIGAALATIFSYFLINVLYFILGKKYLDLGLHYLKPFKDGLIVLGLYGAYFFLSGLLNSLCVEMLFSSFLCLLFLFYGYGRGLIPRRTVKIIFSGCRKFVSIIRG